MTDAELIADAKRWTENDYGLPPRVAKDLVALATELEAKLAEVEAKSESRLRALTGQRESFERTRPLCSGCVDKQSGRGCIACERDRAEAKLAEAERERDEALQRAETAESVQASMTLAAEHAQDAQAAVESREKALREELAEVEQRKENERRDIVRSCVSLRNDLERSMERMDAVEAGEKTMREALFDVCGLKETICDEPSGFAIGRHPETREWRVWHVDYPDEGSMPLGLRAALAAGEETP